MFADLTQGGARFQSLTLGYNICRFQRQDEMLLSNPKIKIPKSNLTLPHNLNLLTPPSG